MTFPHRQVSSPSQTPRPSAARGVWPKRCSAWALWHNYLNSDDPFLIQTIETWMERLRQNTTKISLEGELQRNYMLHQMKLRIEAIETELKSL